MRTQFYFSRLLTTFFALFFCSACQTVGPTWEALSLEEKVPLDEKTVQQDITEEEIVASAPLQQPVSNQPQVVAEEAVVTPVVSEEIAPAGVRCLPDPQYVATRLALYEKKQLHWDNVSQTFQELDVVMAQPEKWQECLQWIDDIVRGYTALADGEQAAGEEPVLPFTAFKLDILYQESSCRSHFAEAVAAIPGALATYRHIISSQAAAVLFYYAGQKEYDKVLAAYQDLLVAVPSGTFSPELLELYGHALLKTGDMQQASQVFLKVADARGGAQGWPLRLQAAELLLAQGEFVRAREEYQRVVSFFADWHQKEKEIQGHVDLLAGWENHPAEMNLYRRALHGWLLFKGNELPRELIDSVTRLEGQYAGSDYALMARQLLNKASGSTGEYVDLQLEVVQDLVTEKEFGQALELLQLLTKRSVPPEKSILVQETLDEVQKLYALDVEEKKRLKEQELARKWQEAQGLFDQQKYDLAIAAFAAFLNTDKHEQAKDKMTSATNMAAVNLRKQAAGLFVKSRKIANGAQKAALLMESRRLLLIVLEKYPEADVISKVTQNRQVIEEQIRAIDGDLLEESPRPE